MPVFSTDHILINLLRSGGKTFVLAITLIAAGLRGYGSARTTSFSAICSIYHLILASR